MSCNACWVALRLYMGTTKMKDLHTYKGPLEKSE